ncbi:MAG: serine/threonine protein kinase [Lentisphaerae bacterium]|nr:serine/threonine protein kinase [Lentisphaerota bacterium]
MKKEEQNVNSEALKRIHECASSGDTFLDLSGMGLTVLPPEIGQLTSLRNVFAHNNEFTTLPPEMSQLASLTSLHLHGNRFATLPPEIADLPDLRLLDLAFNRIVNLGSAIGRLTALQELRLLGNRLNTLPSEISKLTNLEKLWLSGNQLDALPPEIVQLTNLAQLYLHDNPKLGLPLEILGPTWGKPGHASPEVILDYYFKTRGSQGHALREIKLILVGRGEVGKSTMADVLQGKSFARNRKRTDGVDITPWKVGLSDGPAKVAIWDFGGQEIMHGTHQFFLTHRSLYVVMVDGRHDRGKQDAEYWLKLVRAFGGQSSVIVVMNRQKAYPFDIDRQYLTDKYGLTAEHFFRTDCERAGDITPVRQAILAEAERMLSVEELFPAKCWKVKERLENMKGHGEDYLSEEQYAAICQQFGVQKREEQQKLLRRLADLGTVVSFPDDVKLSALSVLNPEWATDGIYRVVTSEQLREKQQGKLTKTTLRRLLPKDRWPKRMHVGYVLDLMEKFNLCFPLEGSTAVLVPELLPDKTPPLTDWNPKKCIIFLYQYTVLPHGVLPRFITRTHVLSKGRKRWRSGVVLADKGAEALIKADYDAGMISVWVRGQYRNPRRALLKKVRGAFDHIHSGIQDLDPVDTVALRGHPEVQMYYHDLILDERRDHPTVPVTIAGERMDVPIGEFLDHVISAAERRKEAEQQEGMRIVYVAAGAHYHEREETMTQYDHSTSIGRDNYGQVGQTLDHCTNMIQQQKPGKQRDLLEALDGEVKELISMLPEEQQEQAAGDLELMLKGATAKTPNRKWYSVSAEGLLEASKWAKDFTGNIAGTIGQLGKLLWADFELPKVGGRS